MAGDYAQATARFEESLALFREMGAAWRIDLPLEGLAQVAMVQVDYATARLRHEECLVVRHERGDTRGIAWALHWLAHVAVMQGNTAAAAPMLAESLALFQNLKNQRGSTYLLEGYAELALAHRLPKRAARLCGVVEALREAISSAYEFPFPEERVRHERLIAAARAQLDDAAFDAAWATGQAMTLEQAIAYALGEDA
jgi:non-specific serine/threonine protein kinase